MDERVLPSSPANQVQDAHVMSWAGRFETLDGTRETFLFAAFLSQADGGSARPEGLLFRLRRTKYGMEVVAFTAYRGDRLFDEEGHTSVFTLDISSQGVVQRAAQFLLHRCDGGIRIGRAELFADNLGGSDRAPTAVAVAEKLRTRLSGAVPADPNRGDVAEIRLLFGHQNGKVFAGFPLVG